MYKLEFGHAATLQEFDWDNRCSLKNKIDHLLVAGAQYIEFHVGPITHAESAVSSPHISTMNTYMYTPLTSHIHQAGLNQSHHPFSDSLAMVSIWKAIWVGYDRPGK